MSLDEVLMRATIAPARTAAMADGIGTLRPGAPADVAVFRRVHGPVTFTDGFGGTSRGSERLEVVLTIIGGRIAFDARADMIKQTLRPAPPNKETR
jgi:dihydroorotase